MSSVNTDLQVIVNNSTNINCSKTIEEYIGKSDWRIKANANSGYSHAGLINNTAGKIIANYWLDEVYSPEESKAHRDGDYHIHDLDTLAGYCAGWSLRNLLNEGFNGVDGRVSSRAPKHFREALGQMSNFLGILQSEWAGAQAFSSFDTYLAPYVFYDKLNFIEVKKAIKQFVYNLNVPARWGQCLPETTEILTKDGFKTYNQIKVGDLIYTLNSKQEYEFKPIREIQKYPFKGSLHRYTGRDYQQTVSPEHQIMYKKYNSKEIVKETSKDLFEKNFKTPISFPVSGINTKEDYKISDEELQFIVFILTEGCIYLEEGKKPHLDIYKSPRRWGNKEIIDLSERLNLKYTLIEKESSKGYTCNRYSFSSPTTEAILNKINNTKKEIPSFFKELSIRQAKLVLDTWKRLDGHAKRNRLQCDTQEIADVLQEVALLAGYGSIKKERIIGSNKKPSLYLFLYERSFKYASKKEKITYDGLVWCPNTENGNIICREEGRVFITGNSPFTNITLDIVPPVDLAKQQPNRDNRHIFFNLEDSELLFRAQQRDPKIESLEDLRYGHFQEEMSKIVMAYYEVMTEGDSNGQPFTFPIPTVNITEDFNWDSEVAHKIFENSAKMGCSYFQNFVGSQWKKDADGNKVRNTEAYKPGDVRSMCCRLQLSVKELLKRGNGLFGSAEMTGCYDEQTEVLTQDGWKFWKDTNINDLFYTLSSSNKIELQKASKLFKEDYSGKMYSFKTRNMDLLVTPNHNMLVDTKNGERTLVTAENLSKNPTIYSTPKGGVWIGEEQKYFELPAYSKSWIAGNYESSRTYLKDALKIKAEDWFAFMGLFLSEGWVEKNSRGRVIITQKKEKNISKVEALLNRLPFKYTKEGVNYSIHSKQLNTYLLQFGYSKNKFIPKDMLNADKNLLTILYDWLMLGDGSIKECTNQETYYTSSKQLANDLQELNLKLGFASNIRKRKRLTFKNKLITTEYSISRHLNSKAFWYTRQTISTEEYTGKIYCAEVPNHSLYVRRNGKATWCGNSIGVVTLNMARLGYKHKGNPDALNKDIIHLMDLAFSTLEKKRKFVQEMYARGLYPYTARYLPFLRNHFSTIGVNGINEMIRNFSQDTLDVSTKDGMKIASDVLDLMRTKILEYQNISGNLYNLEATPAEGTTYRFAKEDMKRFPDIIQAGTKENNYYTNSSQLPANFTDDPFEALDLQNDLQCKYTGGTVLHLYMNEKISSPEACKKLVKRVVENYQIPYLTITPIFSICEEHGYLSGEQEICPRCDKKTSVWTRVMGYFRPVSSFNIGKKGEHQERKFFKENKIGD